MKQNYFSASLLLFLVMLFIFVFTFAIIQGVMLESDLEDDLTYNISNDLETCESYGFERTWCINYLNEKYEPYYSLMRYKE